MVQRHVVLLRQGRYHCPQAPRSHRISTRRHSVLEVCTDLIKSKLDIVDVCKNKTVIRVGTVKFLQKNSPTLVSFRTLVHQPTGYCVLEEGFLFLDR